jgi:hypothetical protein
MSLEGSQPLEGFCNTTPPLRLLPIPARRAILPPLPKKRRSYKL